MLLRILCLPVGIILLSSMILSLRISSSVGLISNSPVRTFQILSRRKELRHRSSSTGLLLHSNNLASKTITSKRPRSFSLTTSSRLFSTSSAAGPPWPSTLLRFDGGSRGNPSPTSAWGFVAYEGVSSGEATDWCERGSRWGTIEDLYVTLELTLMLRAYVLSCLTAHGEPFSFELSLFSAELLSNDVPNCSSSLS